jgi:Flp pilus assembly protein TadG
MVYKSSPDKGQSIVEFALLLPLITIVLIGIIDFSILLYNKAVVTNASREAARRGSVYRVNTTTFGYNPLSATEVQQVVYDYIATRAVTFGSAFQMNTTQVHWNSSSPPPAGSVATWPTSPPSRGGGTIAVDVTYTYTFLAFPRLAGWTGTTTIPAQTIMRME